VVIRDVTEQLAIQQQLQQAQKMEAIGQFTAGIAHDFNNLLTIIHSYTSELLLEGCTSETREMLEPVQTAAVRATTLIRQLLIFSRREIVRPQTLDIGAVLNNLRSLLRRLIGSHIDIQWNIADDLPLVIADPASLEQIVVNLVVNARDAMPDGGRICIEATPRLLDAAVASLHVEAKPGRYIEIRVTDTGTGIPPGLLPRIFEPFFTTKEAGKGTGLGLSTVYSIVRQHGGWIEVESQPGTGTTFTIFHPIAAFPDHASPSAGLDPTIGDPSHRNVRHVLLVEDDPAIQKVLATLLERRHIGFSLASDGIEALALWTRWPTSFDLLITDIVMPHGMNGLRLARSIREQNPQLAVILMSGYSDALADPRNLDMPGDPPRILLKPFTPDQLLAAIDAVGAARVPSVD
jgi:nitrogen-specific signal transduction histidine kinase/ActR/RegA family two-component response regulator